MTGGKKEHQQRYHSISTAYERRIDAGINYGGITEGLKLIWMTSDIQGHMISRGLEAVEDESGRRCRTVIILSVTTYSIRFVPLLTLYQIDCRFIIAQYQFFLLLHTRPSTEGGLNCYEALTRAGECQGLPVGERETQQYGH